MAPHTTTGHAAGGAGGAPRVHGGGVLATGLVLFAAAMLIVGGIMDVFRGIMGIAEDDVFVATQNYVFQFNLSAWGWIHLVLGAIAIAVGLGLFQAALWARIAGVVIAALMMIAAFASIPYYPVWSIVLIAIYGFVIWALCVAEPEPGSGRA
ncbi:hypothetical protein [Streptomyces sp. B6B3]|uniref:DUF7144 family membrane protein n=1 Tax=Streptomyces sp. B6B3 TaxID=3153570 RepID=UPI00325F4427